MVTIITCGIRSTVTTITCDIRSTVTIIDNYNNVHIENAVRTVLRNRSYSSSTKHGKKISVVGDSHIRRIRRNLFIN